MPMYTFVCAECEHTEDELVPFKERETARGVCPKCGGATAWRGVDAPAIGGFHSRPYQTKAFYDTPKGRVHVDGHFGKEARKKRKGE